MQTDGRFAAAADRQVVRHHLRWIAQIVKTKYSPPEESVGDYVHTLARAGLGAIPILGAAATETLELLLSPPLEQRKQQWMETIGRGLHELERKGLCRLEDLRDKDTFIDVVTHASQIAIRSSQKEKLKALNNCSLNSALGSAPEEALQEMFLSILERFTDWHLRFLELLDNPLGWFEEHAIKPRDVEEGSLGIVVVETAFPELKGREDFYNLVLMDLGRERLVFFAGASFDNPHQGMTERELYSSRTTEVGKAFLEYIKSPITSV